MSLTDDQDIVVELNIDGHICKFHDTWVGYKSMQIKMPQTLYKEPKNLQLLIKGYVNSRERILLLRIIKAMYKPNLSNTENTNAILKSINKDSNGNMEKKEMINSIVIELKHAYQTEIQKTNISMAMDELNLYRFQHKIFGVVGCPFTLGEYLPKVKFKNFYVITNLISLCPSYEEEPANGWLNTGDKIYAWLAYIIKYHVNSYDYRTKQYEENIICIPFQRSEKRAGRVDIGWYKTTKKIHYVLDKIVLNAIRSCYKTKGVLVLPFTFFYIKESVSHQCVLIINFQTKEILFANPWGVICKENNCYKTESYDITMQFIENMKTSIYIKKRKEDGRKEKIYFLKDFSIIQFAKCSPKIGPQKYDNLCLTWSMMITHLYLLNYKEYSLYEIIEYLNTVSHDPSGTPLAERYDYLTKNIIPAQLTKKWYKNVGLTVPLGY